MDPETKKLLQEELEVNKENNKLLQKLVWYQKWMRWLNIAKWIIVVGVSLGALYIITPMLNSLWDTYADLLGTIKETSVQTLPNQ
ncbi:MAG: hypothetical protein WC385_02870 [Candidatus Paceibacterota bacterium]|jgi:hypothetical protein